MPRFQLHAALMQQRPRRQDLWHRDIILYAPPSLSSSLPHALSASARRPRPTPPVAAWPRLHLRPPPAPPAPPALGARRRHAPSSVRPRASTGGEGGQRGRPTAPARPRASRPPAPAPPALRDRAAASVTIFRSTKVC
jgi:hypothetical protein